MNQSILTRHIFTRYALIALLANGCIVPAAVAEETTYYQLTPDGRVSSGGTLSDSIASLSDPDASRRLAAVETLKGIYPDEATRAIPALIPLLNDPSEAVRQAVAETLGGFGSDARGAIAGLIQRLSDPIEPVRNAASAALFYIGVDRDRSMDPEPEKALQQALQKVIADTGRESIRTQLMMVDTLGGFACIDSPRYRPCQNLTAPAVHDLSIKVLTEIAGNQQFHSLVRERACGALAGFRKQARSASSLLVKFISATREDPGLRVAAINALAEFGAEPGVTQALAHALKDPNPLIRQRAAWALGRNQ